MRLAPLLPPGFLSSSVVEEVAAISLSELEFIEKHLGFPAGCFLSIFVEYPPGYTIKRQGFYY